MRVISGWVFLDGHSFSFDTTDFLSNWLRKTKTSLKVVHLELNIVVEKYVEEKCQNTIANMYENVKNVYFIEVLAQK